MTSSAAQAGSMTPACEAESEPMPEIIPDAYAPRIAALRHAMREAGLAAALFDEIEAMRWLAGYGNSLNRWRCLVVPLDAPPFIVMRALDAGLCRRQSWVEEVIDYRDWEDPMPHLAAALARRGITTGVLGFDGNSYAMSVARFRALATALPGMRLQDLGPLVNELRLIKTPPEIAALRRAAGIADEAMRRVAAAAVPGATQRQLARVAVDCYLELGADPSPPGPITTVSGWDFLHGETDDQPFVANSMVHAELTPRIGGYSARFMRCIAIGKRDPEKARVARILADLQDAQIAAMRPGAVAEDVDAILRQGVIRTGLRDSYDNITGYTLGLYAPQTPRTSDFTRILHPGARWTMEPGMVFHIYASAGGAAMSETVLVTEAAPELLTHTSRELLQGGIG